MDPMNKVKQAARQFFGRRDVCAEVFNYTFAEREDGRLVAPEDLYSLEGRRILEGGDPFHVPGERDVMWLWQPEGQPEAILALHLAYEPFVPGLTTLLDALTYFDEIATVSTEKARLPKVRKGDEIIIGDDLDAILDGCPKGVKLVPVCTVTVYLGETEWDMPLNSQALYPDQDHDILRLTSNYKTILFDPAGIQDAAWGHFQSELRSVLPMLKYRSNLKALEAYFGGERPDTLSPEAAALLQAHGYPNLAPEKG